MHSKHVAEPFRSILNSFAPHVRPIKRKCCMCFEAKDEMIDVDGTWWCRPCHEQFTADMNREA